jgi:hypothetical protein
VLLQNLPAPHPGSAPNAASLHSLVTTLFAGLPTAPARALIRDVALAWRGAPGDLFVRHNPALYASATASAAASPAVASAAPLPALLLPGLASSDELGASEVGLAVALLDRRLLQALLGNKANPPASPLLAKSPRVDMLDSNTGAVHPASATGSKLRPIARLGPWRWSTRPLAHIAVWLDAHGTMALIRASLQTLALAAHSPVAPLRPTTGLLRRLVDDSVSELTTSLQKPPMSLLAELTGLTQDDLWRIVRSGDHPELALEWHGDEPRVVNVKAEAQENAEFITERSMYADGFEVAVMTGMQEGMFITAASDAMNSSLSDSNPVTWNVPPNLDGLRSDNPSVLTSSKNHEDGTVSISLKDFIDQIYKPVC